MTLLGGTWKSLSGGYRDFAEAILDEKQVHEKSERALLVGGWERWFESYPVLRPAEQRVIIL